MRLKGVAGFALGIHHPRDGGLLGEVLARVGPASPPQTKTASATDDAAIQKQAFDLGLTRVAGNVYEQPATRDFWAVKGGKLVRLTGAETEVDDGERLDPADVDDPENTLHRILADLEF